MAAPKYTVINIDPKNGVLVIGGRQVPVSTLTQAQLKEMHDRGSRYVEKQGADPEPHKERPYNKSPE